MIYLPQKSIDRGGRGGGEETYCGISVHASVDFMIDKKEHKSRNKGETIVEQNVIALKSTELIPRVSVEEREVHIQSHGKGP